MLGSYEVAPLAYGGDIYALYDPGGNRVAMGTRAVCQTLLYLITNSSLMEGPRHAERGDAGRRRRPGPAPADGAVAVAKSPDPPASGRVTGGVEVPTRAGQPKVGPAERRRDGGTGDAQVETPSAGGANLVAAASRLSPAPPKMRNTGPGMEVAYGIIGGAYFSSPPTSSYRYVGLFVALVLGSAALMFVLLQSI